MELEREKAIVRRRTWAGIYSNPKKDRNIIDHYFSKNLLFFCLLVARTKKNTFGQNRQKDTSIRKQWQIALWVCPKFWFPNPMVQNLQNMFVKSKWAITSGYTMVYPIFIQTQISCICKYHIYIYYLSIVSDVSHCKPKYIISLNDWHFYHLAGSGSNEIIRCWPSATGGRGKKKKQIRIKKKQIRIKKNK